MRKKPTWMPRLSGIEGTPCDRLVTAMAEDIVEGRIEANSRLPPHRELAIALGLGLGTVTKAYGLLERRGLTRTVKGSGTFVALSHSRSGPTIDLSRNVPPAIMTERVLARTMSALAKRPDSHLFNSYPPAAGHDEYRRQMAHWYSRLGMDADPRRLMLTSGAHHALAVALSVAAGPQGHLLVESHTYPGAIALARYQGLKLVGVEADDDGMSADALDRALHGIRESKRALYVTPTMQNPTTTTMSLSRRKAIVRVCIEHDVQIIEDDVYSLGGAPALPPLAMLAPERTLYVNGLSKTLCPSLRIGGLVTPPSLYAQAENILQVTSLMVSSASCAVMEQWMLDGTADAVSASIREESRRRYAVARTYLGDAMKEPDHVGFHLWLPMERSTARLFEEEAKALGVIVTPADSTAVGPDVAKGGIRLCIGAVSQAELQTALPALSALMTKMSKEV
ncbi:PLP-dependent aminotransferase family protein [Ferrovibrio terrae]|uniref:PLP-dependent aminotransferase family protein n=1 Tax=Ferrovibrio terrae TaxID=2594003 RepID=A0A516H0K3_9PROT|nr:PLP-dependent aminotransferase family protein [Ferrovibrio terrae]QDO97110.1 PLP-dependent aminotransferase family protein [Ferrovibrio terrae]